MLNIVNLKKNNIVKYIKSKYEPIGNTKYYPTSTQEWKNSVYTFNKNTTKIIPVVNNYTFSLLKSYFNMFNRKMERKVKLARIRRWKRRRYGRQLWISKPEFKYSNNKIIINIYIYNRQYTYFLKRLSRLKSIWSKNIKFKFKNRFKKLNSPRNKKFLIKKIWTIILKKIKKKNKKFTRVIESAILKRINNKIFLKKTSKMILNHLFNKFFVQLVKKILRYQVVYLRYKQIVLLNKLKFKDAYIIPIKHLIEKIYNKKIEFNLVSLKKFNLNSDILAQIITVKINNRRNRPLNVIKASIRKSIVYKFNKHLLQKKGKNSINNNIYNNNLNIILENQVVKNNNIENIVFSNIKNKVISGIKVQISGRITKRLIAQRAKCKIRYKGTLKNIDSSYKGLSSVILKGHEKSSLQYTHLSYKRKIGSFGFKGWINSY